MSREIKIKVYGRTFYSIREFIKYYNTSFTLFYKFYDQLDDRVIDKHRTAALNLIEHIFRDNHEYKFKVYGMNFKSLKECASWFCISENTLYKMMKYNPDVEYCLNKILGKNKKNFIRNSEINTLINKFIYGKSYFNDFLLTK